MNRRWVVILLAAILILSLVCLLAQLALSPWPSQAQAPAGTETATPIPGDAYEPDDPDAGDPSWIADGETQNRSFDPEGDVDRARLYVKVGHWYQVQTAGLGPLVDTVLSAEVSGTIHEDDDNGAERLASRILFQAPADGLAMVTITNRQAVYGPEQTYKLTAGEVAAPTATPTSTPRPTNPPPPTATPPRPVINFSATPERLARPGDCATVRWAVDRASEVFLVLPNGNQEGVEGLGERQVCPSETSEYVLKVNAPGGNETVRVQVTVPLPTPTAVSTPKPAAGDRSSSLRPGDRATLHVVVFVDNNGNGTDDPDEGVSGALVYLRAQAAPDRLAVERTDSQGQVRFRDTAAGSYAVLIPHAFASLSTGLGRAEAVSFRGEEATFSVVIPALRLPSRIP